MYKDIIGSFGTLFYPFHEVAIDEGLVSFNGHIMFKVFNPAKQKKYGVKSHEICDGGSAHCLRYCGATENVSGKGKTYDVVMRLLNGHLYMGRILYVNNFYSLPVLFCDLSQKLCFATGTARSRKGLL